MNKKNFFQKGLVGIVVFLFCISFPLAGSSEIMKISFPTEKSSIDSTVLEVEIIDGPYAIIKNVGNADAINVNWEMRLDCSFLFVCPGKQSGTIDILEVGEEEVIPYEMNGPLFGFGLLKLKATAKADNADKAEDAEVIGFLFGSFIFVV